MMLSTEGLVGKWAGTVTLCCSLCMLAVLHAQLKTEVMCPMKETVCKARPHTSLKLPRGRAALRRLAGAPAPEAV